MALTLSAIHAGAISFPIAATIVLGSETGTTIKILLSAMGGVWLSGRDNDIFTQIGLVVLVGLSAKNSTGSIPAWQRVHASNCHSISCQPLGRRGVLLTTLNADGCHKPDGPDGEPPPDAISV